MTEEVKRALNDINAHWISVSEASRLLRQSEFQTNSLLRRGRLVSEKIHGRRLILKESVAELLRGGVGVAS